MHESIGYTATLNIFIIFFVVVFAFIFMSISYFKANKVSNVVTNAIEKYEGYNSLAEKEIIRNLRTLGYDMTSINCPQNNGKCTLVNGTGSTYKVDDISYSKGEKGYCVYFCENSPKNSQGLTTLSDTASTFSGDLTTTSSNTFSDVSSTTGGTDVNESDNNKYNYYYFRIRTNMLMNVPLINKVLNISIYSNTNSLYDFDK